MKSFICLAALFVALVTVTPAQSRGEPELNKRARSPFGIAWGYLYDHFGAEPGPYLPGVRSLGADLSRVILFWEQLEPQKGRFDWSALDNYVQELRSPDEGFVTLYSTSSWATTVSAVLMPAAPAKDPDDYYRFVFETVKRHAGRVRYWGNDAEPTNPAFWAGSADDFIKQLQIFHRAVKDADPQALVVLGGCDGLFIPPGLKLPNGDPVPPMPHQDVALAFFDQVLREASDAFDVFDLRLYLDPETIVPRVEYIRARMRANGYEKPIIGGEYGGPSFFEFPENWKYLELVTRWSVTTDEQGRPTVDPTIGQAIARMYDEMSTLAPQTQMFMQGCPPELDAKLRRIQSRTLVMQNLFALAAGVERSLYWNYSPATNERDDIMYLMFGKFALLDRRGDTMQLTETADAFQRMTSVMAGVQSVTQVSVPQHPAILLFKVDRGSRGTAWAVWERRDRFSGEDAPPIEFTWPTNWRGAAALDVLGAQPNVNVSEGRLSVLVGATPTFIFEASE